MKALDHLRFSESRSLTGSFASSSARNTHFVSMATFFVFQELRKDVEAQPYMESINRIEQQVANGLIPDSRTLEIEFIHASEVSHCNAFSI
jgi:hypothetical protein